jgi:hypothetical protein
MQTLWERRCDDSMLAKALLQSLLKSTDTPPREQARSPIEKENFR